MEASVLKYILFDYLSGLSNPSQRQLAEEWLKDAENTDTFYQLLFEWEISSPKFIPSQKDALARLLFRIKDDEQNERDPLEHVSTYKVGSD